MGGHDSTPASRDGWRTFAVVALAVLLSAMPMVWPAFPPLVDLPGHIGRYHIAAELAQSPALQRHWAYHWALVGNLGVDLPAIALTPWLGAERAAKLVVMAIPGLTIVGLWAMARARGRAIPPLAGFAFALAYGQAFQLGFVNFALAEALALLALAGWIALAPRPVVRGFVFVPIAWLLWLAHSSGWGLFGLCAWAIDLALARERGRAWPAALATATLACLPLALPAIALVMHAVPGSGGTEWSWQAKAAAVPSLMRDRWRWFDAASAAIIIGFAWTAVRRPDWRIDPVLGSAGAILLAAFLLLPRLALDGAYVDMRMLAPALAILLIAIRIDTPVIARRLGLAGAAFFAIRMVATTVSFVLYAQVQQSAIAAIPHIPRGASVLSLVNEPCSSQWRSDRLGHIGGIAIARRDVFENGQWAIAGQQLLQPKPPRDPNYAVDPSQLVYPRHCEYRTTELATALAGFDRAIYTHVWLVDFPAARVPADLRPIFRNGRSTLFAVSRPPRLSPPPAAR